MDDSGFKHFEGKDALKHVVEKQSWGMTTSSEVHGTEMPGYLSAGSDAARELAVAMVLAWLLLNRFLLSPEQGAALLCLGGLGFAVWKIGRGAILGWARLERLHRLVEEERWEIEHQRGQERFELKELYRAKGFQEPLLDDVVDVLMADGDRLLRVMLEEELGLTLETHDHPLKQAMGAGVGAVLAIGLAVGTFYAVPAAGPIPGAGLALVTAAGISAAYEGNRVIPAAIWNLATGFLACGVLYFTLNFLGL